MYPLQNRFFVNALYGEDQLRQRVAFALHQIIVVSGVDITQPSWMTPYLQMLDRNAFGNYRQLLYDITLNPAMGNYLDINGNTRTRPNENYAREILQLFSIGTVRLNPDGTQQLDGAGQPIPTYDQTTINNFARVFTGWRFAPRAGHGRPELHRSDGRQRGAARLAARRRCSTASCCRRTRRPPKDLDDAIDNIFNDPNVGPFISQAADSAPGDEQSEPGLRRAGRRRVQRRRPERAETCARSSAPSCSIPRRAATCKTDANYGRLRHPAQFIANVLRAFNARSADGTGQSDGVPESAGGQHGDGPVPPAIGLQLLLAVGTVVPGDGGVRGPEFGAVLDLDGAAARQLRQHDGVLAASRVERQRADRHLARPVAPLQALAANPGQLVDALNALLLHGTMSAEMRDSIVSAVTAVAASNPLKRARTAVYLVATSSQYQVER